MSGFERRIFVCPVQDADAIRERVANASHPLHGYAYGAGNVSIRLSGTGEEPATHMASDANRDAYMRAQIQGLRTAYPSIAVYETWAEVEAAGLRRIIPPATLG